ncbi:MAG: hypothetical protein LBC43_04210 [Bifidobacteriaceae bacterium]|jgi:predicted amidophosphoribosyltransferase|nr:hypothetical protein [Bifidobacteriaceae bacterium]
MQALQIMVREFCRLIWPLSCAGCGQPDWHVCPQCQDLLNFEAQNIAPLVESQTPIYGIHKYDGEMRNLILGFKNLERTDLVKFFQQLIGRDVQSWIASGNGNCGRVLIVPAPSTKKANLERIVKPTEVLARGVQLALTEAQPNLKHCIVDLLVQTKGEKQENLTYKERSRNKTNTISLAKKMSKRFPPPQSIILVDDVLTTGSTLKECIYTLEDGGYQVQTAMVVAKS